MTHFGLPCSLFIEDITLLIWPSLSQELLFGFASPCAMLTVLT